MFFDTQMCTFDFKQKVNQNQSKCRTCNFPTVLKNIFEAVIQYSTVVFLMFAFWVCFAQVWLDDLDSAAEMSHDFI